MARAHCSSGPAPCQGSETALRETAVALSPRERDAVPRRAGDRSVYGSARWDSSPARRGTPLAEREGYKQIWHDRRRGRELGGETTCAWGNVDGGRSP